MCTGKRGKTSLAPTSLFPRDICIMHDSLPYVETLHDTESIDGSEDKDGEACIQHRHENAYQATTGHQRILLAPANILLDQSRRMSE